MAFEINFKNPETGTVSTYGRIIGFNMDALSQRIRIDVGCYISAEAREEGLRPDYVKEFYLNIFDVITKKEYSNFATLLYERLTDPILVDRSRTVEIDEVPTEEIYQEDINPFTNSPKI